MALSQKITRYVEEGGWIRRMFEAGIALKAQHGEDQVFDLSLGNPVVEPPEEFHKELQRLAKARVRGMHRYMPNAGYLETRETVASTISEETGLPFTQRDIIMTCGAAAALNVILKAILNPGDEVIMLSPYFVEYGYYVDNHGGTPIVVPTDQEFQLDLNRLEKAITPRTRAMILNSPNNPSGVVYGARSIKALGELLSRLTERLGIKITLISDEPYRRIIFDSMPYPQVFPHYPYTVVVHSHAKDLALPGERIGYIAVHPDYPGKESLIDGLTFCNRILGFVNAPALMQRVIKALQGISVDVSAYQRKRDYLYSHLVDMGYSVIKPQGAFYLFPKSPIEDDVAFVDELQKLNVLTVPGRGFGTPGHFRISYCLEDHVIEGAMEGFYHAAAQFSL